MNFICVWNFKDGIYALAERICTVKTSDRSQMNPKTPFKQKQKLLWRVQL